MQRSKGTGTVRPDGYIAVYYKRTLMLQHKAVWLEKYGSVPDGFCIHHKNGDKQDNRLENLELMKKSEHDEEHAAKRRGVPGLPHTAKTRQILSQIAKARIRKRGLCRVEGCTAFVHGMGLCNRHYIRLRKHGSVS